MRHPFLLISMLLLLSSVARAQPLASTSPIPDERVAEAVALLDGAKIGTRYIGATHAVLAVWRVGTGEPVRTVHVWDGASTDPGFTVAVARGGGVGTVYAVTDPPGYETLAFRMNVRDHTGRPWFKGVTTVTVTDTLTSDGRVTGGIGHLSDTTDAARTLLDKRDVRSTVRGHTQEPVGSLVSKTTLMALPIVERVASEIADGVEPVLAIRRTLTGFAVNRGDAFDYAKSRVGARGAYQFMPATYSAMRRTFRRARLDRQFIRGTRDHVNAAMAETCLADSILADLTPKQLERFLAAGDLELGAFIAATYNGGPKYSHRALTRHPLAWDAEHSWRKDRKRPGLLRPTVHYVQVFRTVYRYLQQNTPG